MSLAHRLISAQAPLNSHSIVGLGDFLAEGEDCIEKNLSEAGRLYERAIEEKGCRYAKHWLGLLFERGEDAVGKNLPRAVDLYACGIDEHGDITSMALLGLFLARRGDDLEADVFHAVALGTQYVERVFFYVEWMEEKEIPRNSIVV